MLLCYNYIDNCKEKSVVCKEKFCVIQVLPNPQVALEDFGELLALCHYHYFELAKT